MHDHYPKDGEWLAEFSLDINGVRLMHDLLDYFIKTWPGSPARDPLEQQFALFMKQQMFAMKMEHQLMSQD
jgi:hypothetical protein